MKVAIVGAGPAGLLLAQNLLRTKLPSQQPYEIHLFEKRPMLPPTFLSPKAQHHHVDNDNDHQSNSFSYDDDRTYPIVVQGRGMSAIQAVAPDFYDKLNSGKNKEEENEQGRQASPFPSPTSVGKWMEKVSFHMPAQKKPQSMKRPAPAFVIEMADLIREMLQHLTKASAAATANHDDDDDDGSSQNSLHLHFGRQVDQIFMHNRTMVISSSSDNDGDPVVDSTYFDYDYLVGADGQNSLVRSTIVPDAKEESVPGGYIAWKLIPYYNKLDKESIHGWMGGSVSVLAAPLKRDYTSAVFAYTDPEDPLAHMKEPGKVLEFIQKQKVANDLLTMVSEEEASLLLKSHAHPLLTAQCPRLVMRYPNSGTSGSQCRAVLLGDAGHTFSAALNQGCNAALEDVKVLCQQLEDNQHDWNAALDTYEKERLVDINAAHELCRLAFPKSKWMRFEFLARSILRQLPFLPKDMLQPLPMDLIHDEHFSYNDILQTCRWWTDRVEKSIQEQDGQPANENAGAIKKGLQH